MKKLKLCILFLAFSACVFAQKSQYQYRRELLGAKGEWHKILLPKELFGKMNADLSDIRILGINSKKDTIEAPYYTTVFSQKSLQTAIDFKLINQSTVGKMHYFTYEMPSESIVNDIALDFGNDNFDWKIKLEGSQDQKEWFTVVDDYRILAIRNNVTDFRFTNISFPDAKYQYFRLKIISDETPKLLAANIYQNHIDNGRIANFKIESLKKETNKLRKESILEIDLGMLLPVSKINIFVHAQHDFYRSFSIQAVRDSVKTKNGWTYIYENLTSGILSSLGHNQFDCSSKLVQNLKIVIENQDNMPLEIDSIQVQGYQYELTTRLSEKADYYLVYGQKNAIRPTYDLLYFKNKIPENCTQLSVGAEQRIDQLAIQPKKPFFESKLWLWSLMCVIIAVLGWFSLKMMREKGE
jgi:hypothetical protein